MLNALTPASAAKIAFRDAGRLVLTLRFLVLDFAASAASLASDASCLGLAMLALTYAVFVVELVFVAEAVVADVVACF